MKRPAGLYSAPYPVFLGGVRVPAINNWDMAFIKNTMVYKEKVKLQFRLEMINAFNRVWFGGLNTTVTSPVYTQLTSQANQPRNIQLELINSEFLRSASSRRNSPRRGVAQALSRCRSHDHPDQWHATNTAAFH